VQPNASTRNDTRRHESGSERAAGFDERTAQHLSDLHTPNLM
jgi:hypothetical protein